MVIKNNYIIDMSRSETISVRFDNKKKVEWLKKAASLRRWSFNTFVVAACDQLAEEIFKMHGNGNIWGKQAPEVALQESDS
jgi:uncharacterized protein (DUF1778 family)